jgi:hypothetical protein
MCGSIRVGKVKYTKTDIRAAHSTMDLQHKMDQREKWLKKKKDQNVRWEIYDNQHSEKEYQQEFTRVKVKSC